MATFIRPTIRPPYSVQQVFATHWVNGAQVSQWVPDQRWTPVPSGTPGRVGEIMDSINRGVSSAVKPVWSPPYEYEFYARLMIPENEREPYIAKCKEWFDANPTKDMTKSPPVEYNHEMIAKFWQGKTSMPSIDDRLAVFQRAGMPEALIEKHEKWDQKMEETSEKRQKQIDDIFGKYNKTKTKAVSKTPKTKVLKPVKKKMV